MCLLLTNYVEISGASNRPTQHQTPRPGVSSGPLSPGSAIPRVRFGWPWPMVDPYMAHLTHAWPINEPSMTRFDPYATHGWPIYDPFDPPVTHAWPFYDPSMTSIWPTHDPYMSLVRPVWPIRMTCMTGHSWPTYDPYMSHVWPVWSMHDPHTTHMTHG